MRFIIRLILLVIILGAVYALWPRTPHPTTFDPIAVAKLETQAWKSAGSATSLDGVTALYKLYDRQLGFPPFTAVTLAQNGTRSLRIFRTAPDAADQEKALPLLGDSMMAFKNATKADFDTSVASRQLFDAWTQNVDSAPSATLAKSIAEYWGTIYGKPASAFTNAANAYANAMLASGFTVGKTADWNQVEASLKTAYEQLALTLKK